MTGSTEKVHPKRDLAILTLLETGSLEATAKKIGVGYSTLTRWMQSDAFRTAYADARQQVFQVGLSRLQALSVEAVHALKRNLKCGRPMAEIRAASAILQFGTHGAELLDIADRLATLESRLKRETMP